MKKPINLWAGFTSDQLMFLDVDMGWGGYGLGLTRTAALFETRKEARKKFRDVRRVEIREIKKP